MRLSIYFFKRYYGGLFGGLIIMMKLPINSFLFLFFY